MKASRTKMVAVIAAVTLAMLLASWFQAGWQSAKSEAKALREAPGLLASDNLNRAAQALSGRLSTLLIQEDERPYYHYKNLFHDPKGRAQGLSVSVSPLVENTGDLLIASHFQIGSDGRLTIPPINEELENLSQSDDLSENQERLLSLRTAQDEFQRAPLVVVRIEKPEPLPQVALRVPPQGQRVQRQQVFEQQAFAQNAMANTVFQTLEGKKPRSIAPGKKGLFSTSDRTPVQVSTHPFSWHTTELEGVKQLVALRQIETPTGKLTQGFVMSASELQKWLVARDLRGASPSLLHQDATSEGATSTSSLPLPGLDAWILHSDYALAQTKADKEAAGLRTSFLMVFLPAALATFALFIMLIVVVSKSEAMALERSQFAAAAAHELRTPLAGLQLYGDMLADGLGDKNAKEKYARHIADEAGRLGRVVSNVLDFSQMEQNGFALQPEPGNLADTVRQVAERMRHAMDLAGMEMDLDLPEKLDATYDSDAVYRILQNLIDNAEKYSREHADRKLRLRMEDGDKSIYVSVADGGPGLGSENRQRIFKPFKRAAGKDGPAGLGLGLALARSLARQQGGDLLAKDSAYGGAEFVLELPKG